MREDRIAEEGVLGGLVRLYHDLVSPELRNFLYYRVRHPAEARRMRSEANVHPKGVFSLRAYDQYRCIFVHITKTAGTAVATGLFGELPFHYTALTYRAIFGRRDFERYFKFAFVRNPWDRLLSAYKYLKKGGWDEHDKRWSAQHLGAYPDFESFVHGLSRDGRLPSHVHFKPQYEFVCDSRGRIIVDYIGYFETLADDYRHVARRIGVGTSLAHLNDSGKVDYRTQYTPAMKDIVGRLCARDVELFGYSFAGIAKRRDEAAGVRAAEEQ